jgi:4-amino-4-deoxy-L-arabinose transferase-like glycosyltransferase
MSAARRDLIWLLAATLLMLGSGLGLKDPWPPDAPRFALIARDMLAGGDWLIPRVGGVIYADKPPLFVWLQAFAMWVTGSLRIGYLLPALLAGVGTVWLVHDLAYRLWGRQAALSAGIVLLATLQFPLTFKAGQIDPLLCFLTTLSLYGLLRHLLIGPAWGWYSGGFFAAGLGVITKGVGFLPLLILLPWLLTIRRGWLQTPDGGAVRWALGPVVFFAAIALWLAPLIKHIAAAGDPDLFAYRDEILLRQTVERYANAWGHHQPPWYYLVEVIPLLWFPTVMLLPWLVPRWRKAIGEKDAAIFLLLTWIVLVVLFFSISTGKRGVYILPAVPALALAVGSCLPSLYQRGLVQRIAIAALMIAIAVLTVMYVGPPFGILDSAGPNTVVYQNVAGSWVIVALLCLAIFRFRQAVTGFVVFTLIVWATAGWIVIPLSNEKRSGRLILPAAEAAMTPGGTLGLLQWKEQFLLYAHRPLVHFGYRRKATRELDLEAAGWLGSRPSNRLLLTDEDFEPCFSPDDAIRLGYAHRRQWFLIGPDAVQSACSGGSGTTGLVLYTPATL